MKNVVGKGKQLKVRSLRKMNLWHATSKSTSIVTDTTNKMLRLDDDFSIDSTSSNESSTSSITSVGSTKPLKLCSERNKDTHRPVTKLRLPRSSYQVLLPGQDEPITRSRCISFRNSILVRIIPLASEPTEDQIQQLWFQNHEYQTIRSNTTALIEAIKDGKISKNKYCIRGLERYFQPDKVIQRRLLTLHSVLDEQDDQHHLGVHDDSRLSLVYMANTWESTLDAIEQGALDEASSRCALRKKKRRAA